MTHWLNKYLYHFLLITCCSIAFNVADAQPNSSIDLEKDKPKKYEERKLASEKTSDTKISTPKRILQNTFTHYNYYFNANNRVNEIISNAKKSFRDDYTQLLPFYNYTLNTTAQNKVDFDSIIYKVNAGILLHDLRSDWVDDLYLLLGKTYFLRKDFDSASMVFQYINYMYSPKDDGYDIPLGSNASNTNGVFTIATNEKRSWLKKLTTNPTTRNESFLWQARNLIEMNRLADASGILSILKVDPYFPARLHNKLNEQFAFLFYKQQSYDTAAKLLLTALPNAANKEEQSRWEYLAGQMFTLAKNNNAAIKAFALAEQHAIDPYLQVYARLNAVNLSADDKKENAIDTKLKELHQMAKRDKYENYKDVIYYAAAMLQLKKNNDSLAINELIKSTESSIDNAQQKQKSFLLLADVCYNNKLYPAAFRYYDSAKAVTDLPAADKEKITQKELALKTITTNIIAIHLQDSLQVLAKMNDADRIAAVKKIYKQIRKAQGLKDDASSDFGGSQATATDISIFNNAGSNTDFYFNNALLKSQGQKDFKIKWGNRPNVDNWQREAAIVQTNNNRNTFTVNDVDDVSGKAKQDTGKAITYEGLMLNIPLTAQRVENSNQTIIKALFENANIFKDQLDAYPSAIACYEELLRRFPLSKYNEEAMYNLFYCYQQNNQIAKADSIKAAMNEVHPDGNFTYILNNGNKPKTQATQAYEQVYNLFIEGRYNEARTEKQRADNTFGNTYWTSQLLFIEAIYYIKQNKDSIAIKGLQNLVAKFPTSPLAEKANTMIDVLKRRKEIENYLTNLTVKQQEPVETKIDTLATKKPVVVAKKDSVVAAPTHTINKNNFSYNSQDAHYAVIALDKVSDMYSTEAKNAFYRFNNTKFGSKEPPIDLAKINDETGLILVGPFPNAADAIAYVDLVQPISASRIISWLTKSKYSFLIINDKNLQLVKEQKDVGKYVSFIKEIFPNKF